MKIGVIADGSPRLAKAIDMVSTAVSEESAGFEFGPEEEIRVEFILLSDRAEAVDLICSDSNTAVFVDAFTYIAAEERCGAVPALQVMFDGERGSGLELVVNTRRISSLGQFFSANNSDFCTLSRDSLTGFIHPALAIRALSASTPAKTRDIDLLDSSTISIVTEGFENDVEMVSKLDGGGNQRLCETAAVPVGRFAEIAAQLEEEGDALQEVDIFLPEEGAQWQEIPYDILVFPPELFFSEAHRDEVVRALRTVERENHSARRSLYILVKHDDLTTVTSRSFADFRSWLSLAGWNMAAPVGQ